PATSTFPVSLHDALPISAHVGEVVADRGAVGADLSDGAGEEADRVVGHGAAVVGQLAVALLVGADERLGGGIAPVGEERGADVEDRKSTRLNSSHVKISY